MTLTDRAVHLTELMDDPACDPARLRRTLRRFALVNRAVSRWGTVYRTHLRDVVRAVAVDQHRPARILDIGCGAGDVLRRLAGIAHRDGYAIEALGIDPDARALAVAHQTPAPTGVTFRQADSRTLAQAGERFDIVLSNHLLHHLDAAGLARLLTDSQALATALAVHSDIHRSSGALLSYAVGITPLAPGSLLRTDGMRSIRRSYTAAELARALPTGWHVERAGHFRLLAVHHPGEGRPGPHVKPLPNEIAPA